MYGNQNLSIKGKNIRSRKGNDKNISLWNEFLDSFLSQSTIHGLPHITTRRRQISEKIFWTFVVCSAVVCATLLSLKTWRRFQENPTVVSLEKNYFDWTTFLPSLTICPTEPDLERINLVARELARNGSSERPLEETVTKLLRVQLEMGHHEEMDIPESRIPPETYIDLFTRVLQNISTELEVNKVNKDELTMSIVPTEVGICYSAFSAIDRLRDVRIRSGEKPNKKSLDIHGNPLDGDLVASWDNIDFSYKGYLSSPHEVADTSRKQFSCDKALLTMEIGAISIVSSDEVKQLTPSQRKCRLPNESNLKISSIYTYNYCRMECRADMAFRLCGCKPYFYLPNKKDLCGTSGSSCIYKYKDELSKLRFKNGTSVNCTCFQACEETFYDILYEKTLHTLGLISPSNKINVILSEYPKTRIKRNLVFGWSDLLVSIGGTGGLFLGCSLLSFAEIIYFFTFRLLVLLINRLLN